MLRLAFIAREIEKGGDIGKEMEERERRSRGLVRGDGGARETRAACLVAGARRRAPIGRRARDGRRASRKSEKTGEETTPGLLDRSVGRAITDTRDARTDSRPFHFVRRSGSTFRYTGDHVPASKSRITAENTDGQAPPPPKTVVPSSQFRLRRPFRAA